MLFSQMTQDQVILAKNKSCAPARKTL